MSASDKKKLRKEQNAAAMTERQKKANKEAKALKKEIEDAGLQLAGIESVNIHDAIMEG